MVLYGVFLIDGQSSCLKVQFEQGLRKPGSFPVVRRHPVVPPELQPPQWSLSVQISLHTAPSGQLNILIIFHEVPINLQDEPQKREVTQVWSISF